MHFTVAINDSKDNHYLFKYLTGFFGLILLQMPLIVRIDVNMHILINMFYVPKAD